MSLTEFLEEFISDENNQSSLSYHKTIPASKPSYKDIEERLNPEVETVISKLGITQLYSHQVSAIEKIRAGQDVIIVTGTASGKSIAYIIPMMERIIKDKAATALCLYPTKALAQDQLRLFHQWGQPLIPATYDGDSRPDEKTWTRQHANIVLTNPDMLHHGILPNHNLWGDFFLNLKYILIDEAHTLRGVFGSNVGLVLWRLERICRHYGSRPQFILASATLAKPDNFGRELTGREISVINDDGSPSGEKEFFLWNPPWLDQSLGIRKSANYEASRLMIGLIKKRIKSIVFSKSRKISELILRYIKEELGNNSEMIGYISSYRGGYTPEQRRDIEKNLFDGNLLGVSSTNALELGIDVGGLDSIIINGFPGTISSTWQQAGRAGRGTDRSAVFLVGHEDPLDQYYINNPDYFFGKSHEEVLINKSNKSILKKHLSCAAYEKALTQDDLNILGKNAQLLLEELVQENLLSNERNLYFWNGGSYPASQVNIRSASQETYQIINTSSGEVLGSVDDNNLYIYLHPGAVYLHLGETYLVEKLDLSQKIALVKPADCEYYTQPRDLTDLQIISEEMKKKSGKFDIFFGQVKVTTQIIGYQRKDIYSGEALSSEELNLPPQSFITEACWYIIPAQDMSRFDFSNYQMAGALHALEHGLIALLPVFAMCDRWDIGGVSTQEHQQTGLPSIFMYDAYSGGIGLTKRGYEVSLEHLDSTKKLISYCPCQDGCPSCIQSPKCGNLNEPLDKEASIQILQTMLK